MKKLCGMALLMWLVLVVNPGLCQSGGNNKDVPVLQMKETTFDFGQVAQGEKVQHDFDIVNGGKVLLQINKVQPG